MLAIQLLASNRKTIANKVNKDLIQITSYCESKGKKADLYLEEYAHQLSIELAEIINSLESK